MPRLNARIWVPTGWQDAQLEFDTCVHHVGKPTEQEPECLLLPGPLDLHVHGGGGFDAMDGEAALRGMLRAHAAHGTAALLATSVSAPDERIDAFLSDVARVMAEPQPGEARLLGAHLEGPFINAQRLGAQPDHARAVNPERLQAWLNSGVVKTMTYAPEVDPHQQVPALCAEFNVRLQMGHSECSWQHATRCLHQGHGVTHLYNAMTGVHHRQPGIAAAALAEAEFAEIIVDGVHVDEPAFKAAWRAIPQLYGVTDATAAAGMPDGEYPLGSIVVDKRGDACRLQDGTLAGSCLTMDRAIEVLRGWSLSWHQMAVLLSARPAAWLGQHDVGQIAPGCRASWIEIRKDRVCARWLDGQRHEF